MTPEQRADSICKWDSEVLRQLVIKAIKEALRDQRTAWVEAIYSLPDGGYKFNAAAHQQIINAETNDERTF